MRIILTELNILIFEKLKVGSLKWYHKIKHLQHVPMDPVESTNKHLDLESIYEQFVDFANISPIDIDFNNITLIIII